MRVIREHTCFTISRRLDFGYYRSDAEIISGKSYICNWNHDYGELRNHALAISDVSRSRRVTSGSLQLAATA